MSEVLPFDPLTTLAHLTRGPRAGRLVHARTVPAREGRTVEWPSWVAPEVTAALHGEGITSLWEHQSRVAELARSGRHVVVATGTASGKSLGYLLPVLTELCEGVGSVTGRGATALYLAPTKALGADQAARLHTLAVPGVRTAALDGDTPPEERRWVRQHAHYVLTNPDLLHHTLLPGHERWRGFLRALRYVVVDECHVYRGVFGAHVSAVLRRLLRVAARYGASPTVILASATVAEPEVLASTLVGQPVEAVTQDASPRRETVVALWEPPEAEDGTRRGTVAETASLLADLVEVGVQTVAFARSRPGVEAVASRAREDLGSRGCPQGSLVAAYRGGYLPEERRELERALRERRLMGLAATTALELGIDIAGLDAVVMAGWPGTRASFWQQAGRAGRRGSPSLAVLVAADDPLDAYLLAHPELIFDAPVEACVLDPENPYVLGPHLAAAAAELPLTRDDVRWFGAGVPALAEQLVAGGVLRRRPTGWFWAREDRPSDHVQLRDAGQAVQIVDVRSGRVLGTVDEERALTTVHDGAVYVHQGQAHVVTHLDLEAGVAMVVVGDPGWSTRARTESTFTITETESATAWGAAHLCTGRVEVTTRVTGFQRLLPSGEVLGQHPLDLPERCLVTQAVWWTLPEEELALAGVGEDAVPGALHAAEHASIGMLPLLATCDRWDVGGVSTPLHPDTGLPTVMVYDGHAGGAGFSRRGFREAVTWLAATRDLVEACDCEAGCPRCVQSPKCGSGNDPLDKAGAVAVLSHLLSERSVSVPTG
ncbi:DEAD/DEAH box helicase [Ornithinimicrobium cerasi]|uniref:DEAD/DEAH box helicase domain-containing protein n=1 Tax=Ornithinimicrobium cerasi TaxID=2248773 RepID=A0A285VQF2_9MICO|nr:DEAD/DEAH box helicase [Ornithinimicrobium cerasi]SOC56300.1 DEAD/DEAH box helicase domain-containing protein [Ornithinimicrobium cerasi]